MAANDNIKEVARRYAAALFELSETAETSVKVANDLVKVEEFMSSEENFQKTLNSPLVSAADRVAVLTELAEQLKLSDITKNFLLVMAKNGRLAHFAEVMETFREMIATNNNEITAVVVAAEELNDADLAKIKQEIAAKTGKKVNLKVSVDAGIIGGIVIRIGSKMYDFSVRSRLSRMQQHLKAA